jgi:ankyrin repeat protein
MDDELYEAIHRGDPAAVAALLAAGADASAPGMRRWHYWSPLILASVRGDVEVVSRLLAHGASVVAADREGKTALHWAAMRGKTAVARHLLDAGAEVDRRDNYGDYTPLILASGHGDRAEVVSTAALLLERGAGIEARTRWGTTALAPAAFRGHLPLVHFLLDRGARIDNQATDGKTILAILAFMGVGGEGVVEVLLTRGARPDLPDNEGKTALMWAAAHAELEIARQLLAAGARIDVQDAGGRTALIHAAGPAPAASVIAVLNRPGEDQSGANAHRLQQAWQRRAATVHLLLEHGADPAPRDQQHRTALDWARGQPGSEPVQAALRSAG